MGEDTAPMAFEMFQEASSRPHVEDNIFYCHWTDVMLNYIYIYIYNSFLIQRAF